MAVSCHLKCIIFSLLLLAKALLSEQDIDIERSNTVQNLNDPELRMFLTKSLARHPLGILFGHMLMRAVDNPSIQDPMSIRDRRYESSALNDQSFLRFGRSSQSKKTSKRPNDSLDLNDISFLRFGRSGKNDS